MFKLFKGLLLLLPLSGHTQDSLPKPRLQLFDVTIPMSVVIYDQFSPTPEYVKKFSPDPEFIDQKIKAGYNDSSRFRRRHPGLRFHPETVGEVGLSATFRINHKSPFLRHIKPRVGLFYSSRQMMQYEHSHEHSYELDTLFFVQPGYPPVFQDSSTYGVASYSYRSQQVYAELGVNLDFLVEKRLIVYAGILYGMGISIKNEFSVSETEGYEVRRYYEYGSESSRGESKEVYRRISTPEGISTRISFPLGFQHRFAVHHQFSVSFFGEMRPGFETYKVKGKILLSGGIGVFSAGLRFSFVKHKES